MRKLAEISIYSLQEVVPLSDEFLDQLAAAASKALPLALDVAAVDGSSLAHLEEVEISIVDDETIADVHLKFMAIPGATDVITFDHGEIHISVETAQKQAAEYGNSYERELVLYIVHGLLHLAGHDDQSDDDAARMDEMQQAILNQVWQ